MTIQFDSPGPGGWSLDRSHYPKAATPISQALVTLGFRNGFRRVFAELGLPAQGMEASFVNGYMYTRLVPLIGADAGSRRLSPASVVKATTRLHPDFRARNKTAKQTLQGGRPHAIVKQWNSVLKPTLEKTNRTFQQVDVDALDNSALQEHISRLLTYLQKNFELHFWLHGHDLGALARYLDRCLAWRLKPNDALAALAGASPSTTKPVETLCEIRRVLDHEGVSPSSLEDIGAASDEARLLLDNYLADRGQILATGYDIDARRLCELPDVIVNSIRTAAPPPTHNPEGDAGRLRNLVPAPQRTEFDRLLADARLVMDMRDENGPLSIEWPVGLLRRALLAAGNRLVEQGSLGSALQLLEVTVNEANSLFTGGLPPASELERRSDQRAASIALEPPLTLGTPEPPPPVGALPPALAALTRMTQTAIEYLGMSGRTSSNPLAGAGIGTQPYVGVARVAPSPDEAFSRLGRGEILVVPAISPAFNTVIGTAGAIVTADGGALSHAAVLARELGIPAIVGAPGALSIVDGSTIEVDPAAGLIRSIS